MNNIKKIDYKYIPVGVWVIITIVGIILIKIIGLLTFVGILLPIVAIWLIWKRSEFEKNKKIKFTGVVLGLVIVICIFIVYLNRTPSLSIKSPEDNTSVQAETISIKGEISPFTAETTINGVKVDTKYGSFNYQFKLNDSVEKNNISIRVKNNNKTINKKLIITRIFTNEEKAILEAQKIKTQQKKDAQIAKEKAELEAYYKTPGGRICKNHPDWDRDICDLIAKKSISIGMTKEQVLLSIGQPERINKTAFLDYIKEQWIYGDDYIYFEDGILTVVQQSD